MNVVTLTLNPALDKSTSVDQLTPEQKLRCGPLRLDPGGGGINVSKGIKRLGGSGVAVFPSGGHNGRLLTQLLESGGVRCSPVECAAETRENFSVTETSTNFQYRFTLPGASLTEAEADRCLAEIKNLRPDWLVAGGSLPPGLPVHYYEKVAALAKSIGARFILDTGGEALRAAADEGVYLLKPNLVELSALAGVPKLEMDQVDDAALQIIQQGKCETVVVSLGPQGALLVTKNIIHHVPAPVVQKKSTVGAGDSMVAGIVWSLASGKSPVEAVQTGVACGSAATMNAGTELFHAGDVWRLFDWIKKFGETHRIKNF